MSYLYAVQMNIPGYPFNPIKIGFSTNPNKRQQSYTNGPFPVEWLGVWEGTKEDEAALHEMFAETRMNGEWFIPTTEFMDTLNGLFIERDMFDAADEYVESNRLPNETELETRERLFGGYGVSPLAASS